MSLTHLAVAALALLAERPMHPYEMYQTLMHRKEDRVIKVRPGSLYHAVNRLEEGGLVRVVGTDREGNRPERTTYEITAEGHERFGERVVELLEEPINEYPSFPLAIGQAHSLPLSEVIALLTARLEVLRAEHEQGQRDLAEIRGRSIPEIYWLDRPYLFHMMQAEIIWIENLIADLESGAIDWNAREPAGLHTSHKD